MVAKTRLDVGHNNRDYFSFRNAIGDAGDGDGLNFDNRARPEDGSSDPVGAQDRVVAGQAVFRYSLMSLPQPFVWAQNRRRRPMLDPDQQPSRGRSLGVSGVDMTHPRAAFIGRFARAGRGTPYGI